MKAKVVVNVSVSERAKDTPSNPIGRANTGVQNIIAVASGKGVGKSTVTANLAITLQNGLQSGAY